MDKPFLTIFAVPKPFKGHIDVIQRNAIKSWTLLKPSPEIILFGDEHGIFEIAREYNILHEPHIVCNEYGTPLLNYIFNRAHDLALHDTLCYVNADIILTSDFIITIQHVGKFFNSSLMVGQRWNVDIEKEIDFNQNKWEANFKALVEKKGALYSMGAIDYFIFPNGIYNGMPPFALGRTVWDNWLIYKARSMNLPVLDITAKVLAVHQNHDYSHVSPKAGDPFSGSEANRNLEIAGGWKHIFTLHDSTHKITKGSIDPVIKNKISLFVGAFIYEMLGERRFKPENPYLLSHIRNIFTIYPRYAIFLQLIRSLRMATKKIIQKVFNRTF